MNYAGTCIAQTTAARSAEFYASKEVGHEGTRKVFEFGSFIGPFDTDSEGEPELDDAVSTLVVRGTPGKRTKYWVRRVQVITLAEVSGFYQNHVTFQTIDDAWLEGEVVIRGRAKRGVSSGRWLANRPLLT